MAEWAKYWRDPTLGGVELLRASFTTHAYAPHAHEGFAIGVIVAGAETFRYRGANHVAPVGSVVAINPGEMHTGEAAGEGWSYRMLYPAAELLRRVAGELAGRPQPTPFFGAPVMDDPELARRLAELHMALEGAAEPLVRETLMVGALAAMVARHADAAPAAPAVAPERAAVARARRYLEDRAAERPTLEDLAEHVGLSPFHLLRVFRQSVGSTPHAYLNHVRVSRARGLLDSGLPPADVALLCGFADQSHLTRAFRRIVGVPPGQYAGMRKIVLDGGG